MLTIVLAVPRPNAAPSEQLAGLSLGLRAVLMAQKAGASRVVLVTRAEQASFAAEVGRDRRVKVPVEPVAVAEGEAPLAAVARSLGSEAALVLRHDVLVEQAVLTELGAKRGEAPGIVARGLDGSGRRVAGPMYLDAELARALADDDLDRAVERDLGSGRLRALDLSNWAERMDDPQGRRRAFEQLFEACRKPVDGIVARHINRHISLFMSKRLVGTPVTPNIISGVTLLLGMLAGVSVARGGYGPILLGAFLWQWNSILDGVDGELARVRFEHSRLGQWLDTLSDDLSNIVFWAALGLAAADLPYGRWLSICGFVAAGSNLGMAAVYYVQMIAMGSGDVYDIIGAPKRSDATGLRGAIETVLRYVSKKDFFVLFCLVLALFGVLPYVLPVLAVFGVGAFLAALAGFFKSRSRRARGL